MKRFLGHRKYHLQDMAPLKFAQSWLLIDSNAQDLARVVRVESGRIISSLMMISKSLELAEDALQDALEQAIEQWSISGEPNNKVAWLYTVARRRLIDRIRKETHHHSDVTQQALLDIQSGASVCELDDDIPDERLRLIFSCCHPALAQKAQVALTLKIICGLSVKEIARAYLTSEVAMGQRITRAKRKIRDAGIAYEVPEGQALINRLPSVLSTIYLIYNESYSAFEGQTLTRQDLANEAIRLARILNGLLPHTEVAGLLALLLFHDARRPARSSATNQYTPLEKQDRTKWNQELIHEGLGIIMPALAKGSSGVYQIQAAISALHDTAMSWDDTDWHQISALYNLLLNLDSSPIITLNKVMAEAHFCAHDLAYENLLALEEHLLDYQPFYAAKSELAHMLGKKEEALVAINTAILLTKNQAQRAFLVEKREKLE